MLSGILRCGGEETDYIHILSSLRGPFPTRIGQVDVVISATDALCNLDRKSPKSCVVIDVRDMYRVTAMLPRTPDWPELPGARVYDPGFTNLYTCHSEQNGSASDVS